MEQFRADLHIHSRYSRATSKGLTVQLLALWGRVKGLDVLGTGDFTHPGWLDELESSLVEDKKSGLYMLAEEPRADREVPWLDGYSSSGKTRFMLQAEISSIYKRGDKVRKIHNLVFMPNLETARNFRDRLAKVGNLESDGRPILGLDSRDLLEMVLETDPLAFLVPAHIWTPWFSLFGSKSGFDSIEECFGDLSQHIFALETGLSSDPEMNWTISALDRFRLISNSDAHSAEKLGREANRFSGAPSYEGIFRALRGEALGHKFLGSIEFFPEEGKYHMDGHRKCGVVLDPRDAMARKNICPVCGKPLTLGVLHRVLELADRDAPEQPEAQPGFVSLIPLNEVLSEIVGTGPATKKVKAFYAKLMLRFGSEMQLLLETPLEDIAKVSSALAEGIGRMRRGDVLRAPGYDGNFGVITVFSKKEQAEFKKGRTLQGTQPAPATVTKKQSSLLTPLQDSSAKEEGKQAPPVTVVKPNPEQQAAIQAGPGPVLVVAGPGTGKTQTLINRIAALIEQGESTRHILAVTFTRRAAQELNDRLLKILGEKDKSSSVSLPRADTLHALAFEYWTAAYAEAPTLLSEEGAFRAFQEANIGQPKQKLRAAWKRLGRKREAMTPLEPDEELFHNYTKLKESWNLADFTDLLVFWLEQIKADIYTCPFTQVLVDEVQDLSALQFEVIKALVPKAVEPETGGEGLFAIGDPRQSIYGFRGALTKVEQEMLQTWPHLQIVTLAANYRSAQPVLDVAAALFAGEETPPSLQAHADLPATIRLFEAPSDGSEASWLAERIRFLIGSTSHSLMDGTGEGRLSDDPDLQASLSPGDVAVLVRFRSLVRPLRRALERLGLPCSAPEEEAFWADPRVQIILQAAGAFLGITPGHEARELACPDTIVAKGPLAVGAYVQDIPPFDKLFWESRAFRQLVAAWEEQGGWPALLNWVHLQSRVELAAERSERIRIMTLHAAKGLEFEAVFLPALEDGILPFAGAAFLSGKSAGDAKTESTEEGEAPVASADSVHEMDVAMDVEEERRLFYVGMTRAKRALYLSYAARRSIFGRELRLQPSRFVKALPQDMLQRSTLKSHHKRTTQQLTLL